MTRFPQPQVTPVADDAPTSVVEVDTQLNHELPSPVPVSKVIKHIISYYRFNCNLSSCDHVSVNFKPENECCLPVTVESPDDDPPDEEPPLFQVPLLPDDPELDHDPLPPLLFQLPLDPELPPVDPDDPDDQELPEFPLLFQLPLDPELPPVDSDQDPLPPVVTPPFPPLLASRKRE